MNTAPTDGISLAMGELGPFEGRDDDEVVFGHYRRRGNWSPELLRLLCGCLAGGGTFVDVGANIGLVSIPVAERCPGARVHAFEPAPDNHALLVRNLARHGLARSRVTPHPVAAFSREARVPMALCRANSGDHHLSRYPAGQPYVTDGAHPGQVQVRAAPLDAVLDVPSLPQPVVMKVDTQGAEVQVLRGARRLLPHVRDLVIEYWPLGLQRQGDSAATLRKLLRSFPRAALLDQNSAQLPPLEPTASLLERLAFFRDDDPGFFDVWLSRSAPG